MLLYIILEAIVGVIAGILIAACSRRAEGVTYGKLDKAGRITNIVLIPVYIPFMVFMMVMSMFSSPNYTGFLGILGWVVTIIIASVPLACGLGLGFSVALRKKGKSKLSFAMQFMGFACFAIAFTFFIVFYGNLLSTLN